MIHIELNFENDFSALCFLNAFLQSPDSVCEEVWKDPETDEICFGILRKEHEVDDYCED